MRTEKQFSKENEKRMDRKDGINNREEAVRKKKFMEKGKTIGMPIYTKRASIFNAVMNLDPP
ncbi:MAG: hypothetical protein ACLR8P_00215 [Clostridium fessum]